MLSIRPLPHRFPADSSLVYTAPVRPVIAAIVLWMLAFAARWMAVDLAVVGSDSLGPYLQAWSLSWEWLPKPPNPESGDALWYLALPLVHSAASLEQLFQLRMAAGALVAPAAFAAAWWFLPHHIRSPQRWTAGLTAGMVVATDPGLIDTLISGARSYAAPELVGLATAALALALRGSRPAALISAILLVMASDHHPLAAGFLLAALGLIRPLRCALGRSGLKLAIGAALVMALPRIIRTTAVALCGQGPLKCLANIATSNVAQSEALRPVIERALHDRFAVDLGWGWMIVALGVGLALFRRRERTASTWAITGLCGVVLVGASVGYVRSYHLRIAAVPIAVAAAIGLSRWWPIGWVALIAVTIRGHLDPPVGPDPGASQRADAIATSVAEIPGSIWVDQLWWNGPAKVDASAVVLSALLSGQPAERFFTHPQASFVLLTAGNGPAVPGKILMAGDGWAAVRMANVEAAKRWRTAIVVTPHQWGSAFDWMATAHPRQADMRTARW